MENPEAQLPLPLLYSGKVRELYQVDRQQLLMVASDRVSAFDYILPTLIPGKGKVLTALSVFWFQKTSDIMPNHLIAADFEQFPPELQPFRKELAERSLLVKPVKKIRIEAVVRGYLSGSGWEEYQKNGTVCGYRLPRGLARSARLPEPLFTPATKEEAGAHDRNITVSECETLAGRETTAFLREKSLALYRAASEYALKRGIIIADTKFEFGYDQDERIILIDEIFTPDSSRFWETARYEEGKEPAGLDKQYVRDYLLGIAWDKHPPAPQLPPEVVAQTQAKYRQIFQVLTGEPAP